MSKKISFGLSTKSIDNAVKELEKYAEELEAKHMIFMQRLMEQGIPSVDAVMGHIVGDPQEQYGTWVEIEPNGSYCKAKLVMEGETIAFAEFGAGVHYNGSVGSSPHPKGAELGMTIGSYGKGYGKYDSWSYKGEDGQWHTTYGTQAAMPMYKASIMIMQMVQEIAQDVFGGGK